MAGRLAELEAAKQAAVAAEDYDAAKMAKVSIDRVRASAGGSAVPEDGDSHRMQRCGRQGDSTMLEYYMLEYDICRGGRQLTDCDMSVTA